MRKILAVIILFFIASGLNGQQGFSPVTSDKEFNETVNAIAAAASSTTSISSEFTQEKVLSIVSEKIISKGIFFYKKPKQLRWEYTTPYRYLIIISNDKIMIKDDQNTSRYHTQSNEMFRQINNILVGSIDGSILKDKTTYKVTLMKDQNLCLFRMVPLSKQMKLFIKELNIYFDKAQHTVSRLEIIEPSGDYTRIVFKNKKLNVPVPDKKFSLHK